MAYSQQPHSPSKLLHNQPVKLEPVEQEEEESFCYAMQLASSTAISMAMQTAVELGVFDVIRRAGPTKMLSAAEIASELVACKNAEAPTALDRLLRFLASYSVLHCSVVVHEENGGRRCYLRLYSLAPVARFFVANADGVSLGPLIALLQDKVIIDSWRNLKETILEGGMAFKRVHGSDAFEYLRLDSRLNEVFNKAMADQTTLVVKKILESYRGLGNNITTLVDVGGGLGVTLNLITSKYPHIQGINFDLPHVIQHAPTYPRVEHVGGDMFESVPKGDAIFMKWILHDWNDERCMKLLKNCYNAIPEDGKVIVVDAVLPVIPDTSAATKSTSQIDLLMMTQSPGGRERTEQEFLDLAASSGFNGITYQCFACNLWVMEFFK